MKSLDSEIICFIIDGLIPRQILNYCKDIVIITQLKLSSFYEFFLKRFYYLIILKFKFISTITIVIINHFGSLVILLNV